MKVQLLVFFGLLSLSRGFSQDLAPSSYKYKTAKQVIQKVARAHNLLIPAPELTIRRTTERIAYYADSNTSGRIILEEKAYDICMTFGVDSINALACILSHEMGHYYQKKGGGYHFAENTSDEYNANSKLEEEADRFAVYYGLLAGYPTHRLYPAVLKAVYSAYGLSPHQKGYPTLAARIATAEKAQQEVAKYAKVFEAGKWLFVSEKSQESITCFEMLQQKFPLKEVHNNLGVLKLKSLFDEGQAPNDFVYPLSFDMFNAFASSIQQPTSLNRGITPRQREEIIQHFTNAISLDPLYATAYINLTCAYCYFGDYDNACGKINELEKLLKQFDLPLPDDALLIRGISRAKSGNIKKAITNFDLIRSNDAIYTLNRKILEEESFLHQYSQELKQLIESLFQTTPNTTTSSPDVETLLAIVKSTSRGNSNDSLKVDLPNRHYLTFKAKNRGTQTVNYHKGFEQKNRQLIIKEASQLPSLLELSRTQLIATFGQPQNKLRVNGMEYWYYKTYKMAVLLKEDKSIQWCSESVY
ncbi:hypothetical protein V6R21_13410 [Limibacter armeniacum]|uniref:hypothetical protein n=1 Tax=Limibacter armeniacum TaxID=466084 RepID=UPI002FE4FD3E